MNDEFWPPAKPSADQPGTLLEQFQIVATFLEIVDECPDIETANRRARLAVLRHARNGDRITPPRSTTRGRQ